ncbi:hypothetical protein Sru01_16650 [Sphaerisporangium rufum]|uniref:Gluconate kinase n=1 Tax=Sphaerisporangium rufum TaxID=1381558 RepID=A0A919QZK6_9ACTN|nr:hypothetical protein Sru01_16650 [Sphaerisporangium rufum]
MPYAGLAETHSAVVVFLGDHAYKVKKPVDLGFLDFTTREARRANCLREVELNRRLAPDVYEGVADVLGPDGEVRDHLVVMRRMPAARRLATLVRAGRPVGDDLRRVARMLAGLHARSAHRPEIDREGTRAALRARWTAGFAQLRGLPAGPLDAAATGETERLALGFLAGREPLFAARIAEGRVVDGHGDLLAADVFCLPDGPRVLDCLEFDDRLRYLDGLDDAAFLAMDLERLGAADLAAAFLGWYTEFSGDPAPPSLWHHYVAYRAFVRAKVACLRHAQGDPAAAGKARDLAGLALGHLRAGTVALVLVGGLPGTGKSTLAGALADRLGYTVLRSDRVRKELAGRPAEQRAAAPFGAGLYRPEWTGRTYAELLSRARRLLGRGESVVIDASWTGAEHRAAAARLAAETASELVALRCAVPAPVAAGRLASRAGGISDADREVAAAMADRADPWPEAVEIDTAGPADDSAEQALAAVHAMLPAPARRFRRPRLEPG